MEILFKTSLIQRHQPGKQLPQLLHQKGRLPLAPILPRQRIADDEPVRRQGAGLIHNGHLPPQLIGQPGGALQPKGSQQASVLVHQQPRRGSHGRDGPVVRPQKIQHFTVLVGQPGHLPRRHPVQ